MTKYAKLIASLSGISLAELVAWLPGIDDITLILKLLVQLVLLITALVQVADLWRERGKKGQ